MNPLFARIAKWFVTKGKTVSRGVSKAWKVTKQWFRTGRAAQMVDPWLAPLTKLGKSLQSFLAARYMRLGQRCKEMAVIYPRYAKFLGSLGDILLNQSNARVAAGITILIGIDSSIRLLSQLRNRNFDGKESEYISENMGVDWSEYSDEQLRALIEQISMRVMFLSQTNLTPRSDFGFASGSYQSFVRRVERAISLFIFTGETSELQLLAGSLSVMGQILLSDRLCGVLNVLRASVSERTSDILYIRQMQLVHGGDASISMPSQAAELMVRDGSVANRDGIAIGAAVISAHMAHANSELYHAISKDANSWWNNFRALFITDGYERKLIEKAIAEDDNQVLMAAFRALHSVDPERPQQLTPEQAEDEEIRFAVDAFASLSEDQLSDGVPDSAVASNSTRALVRSSKSGLGEELLLAFFDDHA